MAQNGGKRGCGCSGGGCACGIKKVRRNKRMSGGSLEDYMQNVDAATSAIGVQ